MIYKPDLILEKYDDLDLGDFRMRGFRYLLLDIDNTIAAHYDEKPDKRAINFVKKAQDKGFEVILISNNNRHRVLAFANGLNCSGYYFSLKPLPLTYSKIVKDYNLDKSKVICMGDQLFTDVVGANLMHLFSVYVKPLVDNDNIYTKLTRGLEKIIFKYLI